MNFQYNSIPSYRIFVGGFDERKQQYTRARIERVAFPPYGFPSREAFDYKHREDIEIYLFAMDWNSYEVVPLFLVPGDIISNCLDRVGIVIHSFKKK